MPSTRHAYLRKFLESKKMPPKSPWTRINFARLFALSKSKKTRRSTSGPRRTLAVFFYFFISFAGKRDVSTSHPLLQIFSAKKVKSQRALVGFIHIFAPP